MAGFPLTRRTVLAALPASAILSQLASIRWALALDEGEFLEQLQASEEIAIGLANAVRAERDKSDLDKTDPGGAAEWQEQDYRGRSALATASLGLSQVQLHKHVRQEFRGTADAMVERGVPLIPEPRDIVRLSIVRTPAGEHCPPAGEVVWDILLDSLGLLEEREFITAALNAISGATVHVERMNESISEDQWGRAVDAFFDLLEFLLDGGTIIVLAQMLDDRLAKKFLRSVAIKLVPFVGTGYAITAFGLAVHRHGDRLFCAR